MDASRTPDPSLPTPEPPGQVDLGGGAWVRRDDLAWSFSRSGGPGGQNVNKLSTRAELRVPPDRIEGIDEGTRGRLRAQSSRRLDAQGNLVIVRDLTRSQIENREACLAFLRALLAEARVAPKVRRATRPTRGSRQRRLEGKRRTGEKKRQRRRPGDE